MVVEVIDAPWAGVPARIRWFKRRWICREHTCQIATFIEQNHSVCAPRARLGARAIRQLRFEGATISGLARQLGTTWNTVWSHIKPCLQAASDDPDRFAGVRVLGVDERRVASPGPTPTRAHTRSPASWTTRGEDHPTARLSGPGPRKVWQRVQELARRAWRRLSLRYTDRDSGPLQGGDSKNAIAWPAPRTQPASSIPFTSSSSLATPQVRCVAASSKTPWVTADARVIPSTWSAIFCAPHTRRLTPRQQERLREAFVADEAHISVDVAYHCAQQVREVFHQDTPAQGRRLAAHLIQRLPTCPIPEIARLGRTLRKWKDALDAYFDTSGASNAPHRTEAINGIIELGRRIARGYRNPTNYQLRMPLIAGGLDASTHTQL